MEALDQLLMACHCQSINLFVESFLKMVRKLLESDKPSLQILGTNSVSVQGDVISATCFMVLKITMQTILASDALMPHLIFLDVLQLSFF